MTAQLGMVRPGSTLYIPFSTYAGVTGASVTLTGLAVTDIEIYRNGSVTQRASDTGYTLLDTDGIDFDGITGIHGFSIDLSSNATADFFTAGAFYWVVVSAVTVDSQTVNFVAATFSIGYPDAILNTTIATLASQTSFTLTAGPAEDDALNGSQVIIHDIASAVQLGSALVADYTGSTRTVTLVAGTTFTAAVGDNISIFRPALLPTVAGRTLDVSSTGEAGLDWANIGSPTTAVNLSATNIDVDQVVASVSGAVGSVTGNVGGNVTGSVGSVATGGIAAASFAAGAITATVIATDAIDADAIADNAINAGAIATGAITAAKFAANAIDAAALAADAVTEIQAGLATPTNITAGIITTATNVTTVNGLAANVITAASMAADASAEIADAVWDEAIAGHLGAGSTGAALNAAGSAGDPWTTGLPGAYGAGTAGFIIGTNLDAAVSTRASAAALSTVSGLVDDLETRIGTPSNLGSGATVAANLVDIEGQTDDIGVAGAGLTALGDTRIANLDATVSSRLSTAGYTAPDNASISTILGDTNDIQTRLPAALVSGRMDSSVGAMATDTITSGAIAASAVTELQSGLATSAALSTLSTTIGTPAGASVSADIAAIEAQTDDIGAGGAGLTAIPWNAAWDAEVQSEVVDGLTQYGASTFAGGAVASVTGNVGGNVVGSVGSVTAPVTTGTNNDKTGYALTAGERTSIATALLTLDLATITGEAARSVLNALRAIRNRVNVAAGVMTVYEEDDTTTAWTAAITTDASADPVTQVDPS